DAQREHNRARLLEQRAGRERSLARKTSKNPIGAARKAARAADRAAGKEREEAKAKLTEARKEYPETLTRVAVKAHVAHVVPAGLASYLLSTPADWATWPASLSALAIGVNAGAVLLGRRGVATVVEERASAEERALMERLDPTYWVEHASDRGLGGTVTGTPRLGDAGITCAIRLDGTWDVPKLRAAEKQVRALLGCRTALRIGIAEGSHGGWGEMVFRTRSAVDGADMLWTPERQGIGLDTVTGELVGFSPYSFRLVAGATGMGKSVLMRPGMAQVLANPTAAVVYLDPKHQEFRLWDGKCRVEHDMAAIYGVTGDVVDEMRWRQLNSTGTNWVPTPEHPELVVIVDEGAAIVRAAKQKRYNDFLDQFEEIATMGRAARIWLTWATQYPTKEQGIPAQVVEMMLDRAALSVESATADRTIFGEKAAEKGYQPSELGGVPGLAMVRTRGRRNPAPVQTWFLDDGPAATLPAGIVWDPDASETTAPRRPERPALRLVKDGDYELAPPAPEVPASREGEAAGPVTNRDRVLGAVREGARTAKAVAEATGLNKGTVSREVKALVESGVIRRADDGALSAGEVSA
ncbi:MarR family transcriptional regulator, partial [Streptomyces diacarni]|uniref:MarR family transcriptional regulator n=1 Tax=Streptomyces diacarni TaxID=2800381 RepID=UPI0033C94D5A